MANQNGSRCAFCRMKQTGEMESGQYKVPIYGCGSHWDFPGYYRTENCYKIHLANLQSKLKVAKGFINQIIKLQTVALEQGSTAALMVLANMQADLEDFVFSIR